MKEKLDVRANMWIESNPTIASTNDIVLFNITLILSKERLLAFGKQTKLKNWFIFTPGGHVVL
jgi:hypothetical protein